jgi:hypothetical protein
VYDSYICKIIAYTSTEPKTIQPHGCSSEHSLYNLQNRTGLFSPLEDDALCWLVMVAVVDIIISAAEEKSS